GRSPTAGAATAPAKAAPGSAAPPSPCAAAATAPDTPCAPADASSTTYVACTTRPTGERRHRTHQMVRRRAPVRAWRTPRRPAHRHHPGCRHRGTHPHPERTRRPVRRDPHAGHAPRRRGLGTCPARGTARRPSHPDRPRPARARPPAHGGVMDLEVWLVGTAHEVDAALSAFADVGTIAGASK